jgi:hypothetical protein
VCSPARGCGGWVVELAGPVPVLARLSSEFLLSPGSGGALGTQLTDVVWLWICVGTQFQSLCPRRRAEEWSQWEEAGSEVAAREASLCAHRAGAFPVLTGLLWALGICWASPRPVEMPCVARAAPGYSPLPESSGAPQDCA